MTASKSNPINPATYPCTFDELKKRDGPPLNSWGLYGEDNELGRLNLIDEAAVKRGVESVKHGVRVNLNLPLEGFPGLIPNRQAIHREIHMHPYFIDESITMNTQASTQWDGFLHFGYVNYPKEGVNTFHNGMTQEEAADITNPRFGVQNFAKNPISSRAHLLDIARWLEKNGRPQLKPMESDAVTLEMLQGCAKDEGIEFAPGDVLIVRTGWTEGFLELSDEERAKESEAFVNHTTKGICGVDQSEEVMRWHWDNGIAAVASDAVAYEAFPSTQSPGIHEVFLAGWGIPLGELFDLRELSKVCAELNQYTFLFTSMGLNLDGGIATPPNAQAIL